MLVRHGWQVEELLVYLNPKARSPAAGAKQRLLRSAQHVQRTLVRTVSPYLADGLVAVARCQS